MKRYSIRDILLFCLVAGSLSSCVEWVGLNTEDPQEIVVNCVLTDSDEQNLQLCWSSRNDDSGAPAAIGDAKVVLSKIVDGNAVAVGSFRFDGKGLWKLGYRPEGGAKYRISVNAAGHTVYAETEMPCSFNCINVPNPALVAHPEKVEHHCYPSRRVLSTNPAETSFHIVAWFSGIDGVAQELYTTHDGTDGFNLTGGGFLFDYFSYSTPGQMEEGDQYVHFFPFYNRVTVIPISQDYTASYYYPIYTSMFSSSLFNMSVMISGHPEYGAYVKDGIIWGPDFDIWPRYSWQTSELHILKPSASLLAYIKSMVELTPVAGSLDFTEIFKYESPYTNIEGGRGIFGGAALYVEDYKDYDKRMTSYYNKLYEDEENRQGY